MDGPKQKQSYRLTTAVVRTALSLGDIQIFQIFITGWWFNTWTS